MVRNIFKDNNKKHQNDVTDVTDVVPDVMDSKFDWIMSKMNWWSKLIFALKKLGRNFLENPQIGKKANKR